VKELSQEFEARGEHYKASQINGFFLSIVVKSIFLSSQVSFSFFLSLVSQSFECQVFYMTPFPNG